MVLPGFSVFFIGQIESCPVSLGAEPETQRLEAIQGGSNRIEKATLLRQHQDAQRSRDVQTRRHCMPARVSVIQNKQMVRRLQPQGEHLLLATSKARNERQQLSFTH